MSDQSNPQEVTRNVKTLPPSCQKLALGMQQRWNRAIPESDYIQLGTLRYGVRLSNPNLVSAATNDDNGIPPANHGSALQSRFSSDSYDQHTNGSSVLSAGGTSSNSSRGANDSCCCIATNGIEMPWNSGYVRTRLPVPSGYL
ncbi:uncharacterized protein LOC134204055, partial [Armigeres subalbatus]|uniref:uncharacterized protein LOC134204055 n=1 Tax=Armigeres subalbatus TaxID=124917 RepID=UPI002ED05F09